MYRNIFRLIGKSLPLLALPLCYHQYQCFSFWNKAYRNDIQGRVHIGVEVSNKPCEDRSAQRQLQSIKGYAVAVFDGHGGWQMSELCSKRLLIRLDERIAKNKLEAIDQVQLIKKSLREAFMDVENEFLETARQGYKLGFGRMARAGSCALVCVVVNSKVYTANAGDSLGLIVGKGEDNRMTYIEVNRQLNANLLEERQRLKKQFPKENDIVICKRENTSCYVKGRLQPTRSLGDLRLKHPEFNNPEQMTSDHDFQTPLSTFTGPYITWQPEITVFDLKKNYMSLVLASDGIWDKLQRQQVSQLFKSNKIAEMPKILIEKALEKAARDSQKTIEQIRKIPTGKKRKIHDDITVVVVDLQKQVE